MATLVGTAGKDELIGGDDEDWIEGGFGDRLIAGAGNDILVVALVAADQDLGAIVIDAGAGDDIVFLDDAIEGGSKATIEVLGGAGRDLFFPGDQPDQVMIVRDFAPGPGGDRIAVGHLVSGASGDVTGNPFSDGRLQLRQNGVDAQLLVDGDGHAGPASAFLALELQGINAATLSIENIFEALPPDGSLIGTRTEGTDGEDVLTGGEVNDILQGGAGNDRLLGGAGDDMLAGGEGDDFLNGGAGDDVLQGGAGTDSAGYFEARDNYVIVRYNDRITISSRVVGEGTDTLQGVERAVFQDKHIAFDIDGLGGQVYRLYRAAFDRAPDPEGLGFWIDAVDKGMGMGEVVSSFIASSEFVALYGAQPSNTQLVTRFYQNILHRPPEDAGLAFWLDKLDHQQVSVTDMLAFFSESPENQSVVAAVIGQGFEYTPWY